MRAQGGVSTDRVCEGAGEASARAEFVRAQGRRQRGQGL